MSLETSLSLLRRKSRDEKVNKKGRILMEFLEEKGWSIFNGVIKGGEEKEYTGSRGNTVIDYMMEEEEVTERIDKLEIG